AGRDRLALIGGRRRVVRIPRNETRIGEGRSRRGRQAVGTVTGRCRGAVRQERRVEAGGVELHRRLLDRRPVLRYLVRVDHGHVFPEVGGGVFLHHLGVQDHVAEQTAVQLLSVVDCEVERRLWRARAGHGGDEERI